MNLFKAGEFTLHSGSKSFWKIDCDALTDEDYLGLVRMALERLPSFGSVEGVPRGGLKLAAALRSHVTPGGPLLIVDDVVTTGNSLERHRNGRVAIGLVIFARGRVPHWVHPLFVMPNRRKWEGEE